MNAAELYRFCVKVTKMEGILGKAFTLECMKTNTGEVKYKAADHVQIYSACQSSHEESTVSTNHS